MSISENHDDADEKKIEEFNVSILTKKYVLIVLILSLNDRLGKRKYRKKLDKLYKRMSGRKKAITRNKKLILQLSKQQNEMLLGAMDGIKRQNNFHLTKIFPKNDGKYKICFELGKINETQIICSAGIIIKTKANTQFISLLNLEGYEYLVDYFGFLHTESELLKRIPVVFLINNENIDKIGDIQKFALDNAIHLQHEHFLKKLKTQKKVYINYFSCIFYKLQYNHQRNRGMLYKYYMITEWAFNKLSKNKEKFLIFKHYPKKTIFMKLWNEIKAHSRERLQVSEMERIMMDTNCSIWEMLQLNYELQTFSTNDNKQQLKLFLEESDDDIPMTNFNREFQ